MLESLHVLNYDFNHFLHQGDPRVKDWPMMQNPFPGMVMIAAYIYFVKVVGPQWMKKKQAYELRILMAFYNFAMVVANFTIFFLIGWYGWFNGYSLTCQPVDYSNSYQAVKMAEVGWWFYVTKFVEFADTVFFVLRKKDSHISALHVIHHSIVPFSLWFGLKFAPGGYNAFFPFLNSFVHVLMYTYYGLAALGPKFQRYVFWKKYMTYIQISQFVAVVIYALALLFGGCQVSKTFIAMNIIHALLFLVLFLNFFVNSYGARRIRNHGTTEANGKLKKIEHVTSNNQSSAFLSSNGYGPKNGVKKSLSNHLSGEEPFKRRINEHCAPTTNFENNVFTHRLSLPLTVSSGRHLKYS